MKTAIVLGSLCLAALGVFILFNKDTPLVNYPPKEGPIIAFGDSLVSGVGASESENFVSVLSRMTGKQIINLGIPGDTTRDGIARIDEVLEKKPSIVLVLLGGNDRLKRVPIEETLANMRQIIAELQDAGAMVVLLGIRGNLLTDRFEEEYERIAEETGSVFIPDVLDGIFGEPSLMSDGIHPNAAGYRIMAENIEPALRDFLK